MKDLSSKAILELLIKKWDNIELIFDVSNVIDTENKDVMNALMNYETCLEDLKQSLLESQALNY